jgi:hypothetical protein
LLADNVSLKDGVKPSNALKTEEALPVAAEQPFWNWHWPSSKWKQLGSFERLER